ncbi:MAG: NF038129 family PEP-CTERM protein [Massilia sp.]
MFNTKQVLARLLLAASLVGAAGQAGAAPIYQVDIDTATLGAGPAFLDIYFVGLANASAATATVTGLTGLFNGAASLSGAVSGSRPGPIVFGNANLGGEFVQAIELGGKFHFDVSFMMAPGSDGTTFGWALFNDVQYLGADGDLGNIFLQPNAAAGQQIIVSAPAGQLSSVNVIPEPSTAALFLLALLALGAMHARGGRRA